MLLARTSHAGIVHGQSADRGEAVVRRTHPNGLKDDEADLSSNLRLEDFSGDAFPSRHDLFAAILIPVLFQPFSGRETVSIRIGMPPAGRSVTRSLGSGM
jgi:hypothetical protein